MIAMKFFRMLRRKSQWELGQAAQIPSYKLSQFECGRLQPTLEELGRLAEALGTTPEALTREISEEALMSSA